MPYEAVIGLEVHAQLATQTKIFCSCPVLFAAPTNSLTCPVCLGLPGSLPVLNTDAVTLALRLALATGCTLNTVNRFVRKNYFYPDLPKGYQISQLEIPFAEDGFLEIKTGAHGRQKIGIHRMHLEEDSAKLLHSLEDRVKGHSYIDYNRAGVPLIEIVSKPDMRTVEQAGTYLRTLHRILQYLDVCKANMEQGGFRCDANVSVRQARSISLGPKVELKNINSFRNVERAIAFEVQRQTDLVLEGGTVVQETRQWDEASAQTRVMRNKEETDDYRYFPDPDLPSVVIADSLIDETRNFLPELPQVKLCRFIDSYGLPVYDAEILAQSKFLADYFEKTVALGADPKKVSNWIMGDIMRCLDEVHTIDSFVVTPSHLAELISLIGDGIISTKTAKEVFEEIIVTSEYPNVIIRNDEKYLQVSDESDLEAVIATVLGNYQKETADYRAGKTKLLGFFVGLIMKATGGRANPGVVNTLLRRKLNE